MTKRSKSRDRIPALNNQYIDVVGRENCKMEGIVGIAQTVERDLYTVKAAGSMPALNTQGTVGSPNPSLR